VPRRGREVTTTDEVAELAYLMRTPDPATPGRAFRMFRERVGHYAGRFCVSRPRVERVKNCIYGATAAACTDAWLIRVSEKWLAKIPDRFEIEAVAFHEMAHLLVDIGRGRSMPSRYDPPHGDAFKTFCLDHGHHPNSFADAEMMRSRVAKDL